MTVATAASSVFGPPRSEEHTSELQSHSDLVCRLLLEKKKDHILNINQLKQEMHRISKDNAEWYLFTPFYLDPNNLKDPTHFSLFTLFLFQLYRQPRIYTLFPYTTLFR